MLTALAQDTPLLKVITWSNDGTPLYVPPASQVPTYAAPTPTQEPIVPPVPIGPGGENPGTPSPTPPATDPTTVAPGIGGGESALSQLLSPKRLLIFAAIGLVTGIWLIGN
jgi:hypothetical protein